MLTLFSVPKPFVGRVATLQSNALATWRQLGAEIEILLFGSEQGVAEAADAVHAVHVPELEQNENGTPLVSDLFARAQARARFDELCYVNADILLPPSLLPAIEGVREVAESALIVGQCRNLEVDRGIDGWDTAMERAAMGAPLRGPGGIDYLVFPRGLFDSLPPFALGRAGFDNWLIWYAHSRRVPVVDVTSVVPSVHQNHEYEHVPGGKEEAYFGTEAWRNHELAGGQLHLFNIDDATHRFTREGLRRNGLAPLRTFPPLRWLALRAGELERWLRGASVPKPARTGL